MVDPERATGRRARLPGTDGAIEQRWSGFVTVALLVAAFAWIAGPIGALAGLVVTAVWVGYGPPYAVATASVLLVGAFPHGIDPVSFAIATGAMGLVVLSDGAGARGRLRIAAVTVAAVAFLGGISWGALGEWSLSVAVVGTLAAFALLSYGLHRYELVRLGLVSDEGGSQGRLGDRADPRSNSRAEVRSRER